MGGAREASGYIAPGLKMARKRPRKLQPRRWIPDHVPANADSRYAGAALRGRAVVCRFRNILLSEHLTPTSRTLID